MSDKDLLNKIRPSRIILPIIIGLAVVGYLFYREFDPVALQQLDFTSVTLLFLLFALFLMVVRDFGYMVRLKILSEKKLSWRQVFRIVMLWEFTSAVTPSAIGGTGIAILYVNKEGLTVGRSTAIVMATSFLDEVYFLLMFPLLLLTLDFNSLFVVTNGDTSGFAQGLFYICLIGYTLKLLWTLVLSYGLFFNPRSVKWLLLLKIFKLPFIRRWRSSAGKVGTDLIHSSVELKSKPLSFWLQSFAATFISWTARYWIVNVLLVAFWASKYGIYEHFVIFGRQLIMWIMMLVSPTPGGSGFAEYVFNEFLGEFVPGAGVAIGLALLWRLISYYPYLIIGAIMLPRWVALKFGQKKEE